MTRLAVLAALAAGLAAAVLTDTVLAAADAANFEGAPLGLLTLPALLALAVPAARRSIGAWPGQALIAAGVAWTIAPFVDQHLTGAVVLSSVSADLVHHLAGWTALLAGQVCLKQRPVNPCPVPRHARTTR